MWRYILACQKTCPLVGNTFRAYGSTSNKSFKTALASCQKCKIWVTCHIKESYLMWFEMETVQNLYGIVLQGRANILIIDFFFLQPSNYSKRKWCEETVDSFSFGSRMDERMKICAQIWKTWDDVLIWFTFPHDFVLLILLCVIRQFTFRSPLLVLSTLKGDSVIPSSVSKHTGVIMIDMIYFPLCSNCAIVWNATFKLCFPNPAFVLRASVSDSSSEAPAPASRNSSSWPIPSLPKKFTPCSAIRTA